MKHYSQAWLEEWCQDNGWTDLFIERCNNFWAFPPGGVMPEPIPIHVLRVIKAEKGLTPEERLWSIFAVVGTIAGVISTYFLKCPMPIVMAFALNAVTVAQLEIDDA
jgi:hypothetical protein